MADLKRYTELKRQVEQAQKAADRAEGALEQLEAQLKKDFNCSSIEEAEKKLKTLTREQQEAEEDFQTALEAFEEKWNDKLEA